MQGFRQGFPFRLSRRLRIACLAARSGSVHGIRSGLESSRFACCSFDDVRRFVSELGRESFDAILVDWAMVESGPIEWLQRLRRGPLNHHVPLIFLGVPDDERQLIAILEAGADAYLFRPIDRKVLRAKVIASVRRAARQPDPAQILKIGSIAFDVARRCCERHGMQVKLRGNDFEVALMLGQYAGRPLSRGHLLESIWPAAAAPDLRVVDASVYRVRSSLGLHAPSAIRIVTLRGLGYRFEYGDAAS